MCKRDRSSSSNQDSPQARLDRLLRTKACLVYQENLPDREHPEVKYSVYGAPKSNEIFVRAATGRIEFVAVAPSPIEYPVMADRVFGIDVADEEVAFGLADKLWSEHKDALLTALRGVGDDQAPKTEPDDEKKG